MKTYKGENALTISVQADSVICVEYDYLATVSILNYTDSLIYVSENDDFSVEDDAGKYFIVTDGYAYNDYVFYTEGVKKIYIKSLSSGTISLIRKRW